MVPMTGSIVRNAGNRSLRGCNATALGGSRQGALRPWQAKGLAKIDAVREAHCRQTNEFPVAAPDMQTRLPRRVLLFMDSGLATSQKSRAHAPDCAHIESLPDYRQPINQPRN